MADDDFKVVSEYHDQEAIDDGVIYDVSGIGNKPIVLNDKPINRISNSVMGEFTRAVDESSKGILKSQPEFHTHVLHSVIIYMLQQLSIQAKDSNGDGFMYVVKTNEVDQPQNAYWLVANEVGGYTLMRPEDY